MPLAGTFRRIVIYSVAFGTFAALLALKAEDSRLAEGLRRQLTGLAQALLIWRNDGDPRNTIAVAATSGAKGPALIPREGATPAIPKTCGTHSPNRSEVTAGDKIRLRFFQKTKLVQPGSLPADGVEEAVFERLDLAGDYEVDETGQIALPLLGRVEARGLTLPCLEMKIGQQFFEKARSGGDVSVSALFSARPPVRVTGTVRSPGSYNFVPGMTIQSLLATAGAPSDGGGADLRALDGLLDRKAELNRQALSVTLSVMRSEAELRGRRELELDEPLRSRVAEEFGTERLEAEQATVAASVEAFKSNDSAGAAVLAGYDERIRVASERLAEVEQQARKIRDRVHDLRQLRDRGIASMATLDNLELTAMTIERTRLTTLAELTDLRAARVDAEQRRAVAVAERRQHLQRELRDAREREQDVQAQIITVERQLARASDRPSSGRPQAGLMSMIRRSGPSGPITIEAKSDTELQPGDIVEVGLRAPGQDNLVARGKAVPPALPTGAKVLMQ
jgi:polysaccharide export outer membrane protein